ncbi:MAG: multifunctional transcriptional regulator/nicotinamide-nucleotide adenylyltransferase/ribosylnicotinamide kinase NadR [Inconstantimicrobium porci]|uniref:Multifunctional transcriptional regulator/nicotinamide-nucleotide adenylyltransferase/ribosylnicotinamide kinase NadR n=1 Tax=Inconstantimicrobium porci TaxID=2652291 RepID=A0A7X2T0W2_9CLOT|nr:multifunctional transcriptional regulator/nicotinamide-nucleotide adenylyltransferase/ribosylnicotinamide kinase NadR [Inconstantimicrobium porci]MDY5912071.1 multifunctional transcriptional regulator/nicotinamide-nucleotide adenylyltransferase/ribosylnicotinamide kinase NadR [Inconstantimicrobium porci]MSR90974.1 multifunctional transcriptional regulator/nicotinamide-nucleotide adenylyltransferase/ribosylnicotinamide kinase NadR [Inconstantimicrobium porci]
MSDKDNIVINLKDLPKVGVCYGKFLPPHRGHLYTILEAATNVQKLYVVVSDNSNKIDKLCKEDGIDVIPVALRLQWLAQQFQDMDHIKVVVLDENNMGDDENSWNVWADRLKDVVKEHIDVFYCRDLDDSRRIKHCFKNTKVNLVDRNDTIFNVNSSEIRKSPFKYWDYILGPARPYFTKKVLITGTESSGKTTLTKSLAKIFNTSWSEEEGRYYAEKFLGGDENYFTDEDFIRMTHLQVEQDYDAMRNANKICFFDTDATATQYYSRLYMGHENKIVESYINPDKYDLVLLLKPDVEWVADGQRLNGNQEKRERLYLNLKQMYVERGFKNIIEISGDYNTRLNTAILKSMELIR